ncbi:hypothetical protein C8J57DRAFT_1378219 [Mycena rebaudengoi]|nr:hypothetical protein C8J57DRAFT_1378219 [Mycena rebaudengoi]
MCLSLYDSPILLILDLLFRSSTIVSRLSRQDEDEECPRNANFVCDDNLMIKTHDHGDTGISTRSPTLDSLSLAGKDSEEECSRNSGRVCDQDLIDGQSRTASDSRRNEAALAPVISPRSAELLDKYNKPSSQTMNVVPGNHPMDWNQDNTTNIHPNQNRPDGIPDEVERAILNDPLLLQVLGISVVLREDHRTIPLISCVLHCTWAEVKEALRKISPYAKFTESELQMTMTPDIIKWLVDRGEEKRSEYHVKVACWCLVGDYKNDAECKLYAAKNWAYHTTSSRPSTNPFCPGSSELHDALLQSRLPFGMVSSRELPKVIEWLQGAQFSQREELIGRLEAKSRKWDCA